MENQTPFDVNAAINGWRSTLAQTSAFRTADLDELELHLRDAIRDLESRDLSQDEAFTIGIRRVGAVPALAAEFTRVNGHRQWIDRALWMLAGWVFISTVQIDIASFGLLRMTTRLTGFLSTSILVLVWAAPLLLAVLTLLSIGPWRTDFLRGARQWLRKPAALAAVAFVVLMLSDGFRFLATALQLGSGKTWDMLSRGYIGTIVMTGPRGPSLFLASSLFLSLLGWLTVSLLILVFARFLTPPAKELLSNLDSSSLPGGE
jgi:hypothetical protein